LPLLGSWRPALAIWSVPVIVTAILVAIMSPSSNKRAIIDHPVRWLPELNSWLNWRIGLILGAISSTYFCINGFLPAYLNGNGHPELVSTALTALNLGQVPASFLLLFTADRFQRRQWPFLLFGLLFIACVIGIMNSAGYWTVFWAALVGATCGAALVLGLALAPANVGRGVRDQLRLRDADLVSFGRRVGYGGPRQRRADSNLPRNAADPNLYSDAQSGKEVTSPSRRFVGQITGSTNPWSRKHQRAERRCYPYQDPTWPRGPPR
jgi:cyanate permease